MPTILQRVCSQMVGTLSLCPPYGCGDRDCPTGKSFPIFGNIVKPTISENQKFLASLLPQIKGITTPVITAR